jgi:hypothetical protein
MYISLLYFCIHLGVIYIFFLHVHLYIQTSSSQMNTSVIYNIDQLYGCSIRLHSCFHVHLIHFKFGS